MVLGFAKAIAVELIFVSFFFKRNKNSGNVKRDPKLRGGHDDAIEGFAQIKKLFFVFFFKFDVAYCSKNKVAESYVSINNYILLFARGIRMQTC